MGTITLQSFNLQERKLRAGEVKPLSWSTAGPREGWKGRDNAFRREEAEALRALGRPGLDPASAIFLLDSLPADLPPSPNI